MDKTQQPIPNFEERYNELSDAELKKILVRRKDYREEAVAVAVRIAIERGIIQSEQDLFAEEYHLKTSNRSLLFPSIEESHHKERLLSSIKRTLYIVGLIPLIFAFMGYAEGAIKESIVFAVVGIVWMFLTYKFFRTSTQLFFILLLAICLAGFAYSLYVLSLKESLSVMDFVVLLVAFLVSVYCLVFAKTLIGKTR